MNNKNTIKGIIAGLKGIESKNVRLDFLKATYNTILDEIAEHFGIEETYTDEADLTQYQLTSQINETIQAELDGKNQCMYTQFKVEISVIKEETRKFKYLIKELRLCTEEISTETYTSADAAYEQGKERVIDEITNSIRGSRDGLPFQSKHNSTQPTRT